MPGFLHNRLFIGALALGIITAWAAGVACGGGDNLSDIKGTATAAAKNAPPPTPTLDPVPAYRTNVADKAKALGDATKKLQDDMIAASTSQADPKWPAVLGADASAVNTAARDVQALRPPNADYQPIADQMNNAATKLSTGADLLKQAVTTLSPEFGAQAAQALDDGTQMLTAAQQALAAKQ